MKEALLYEKEKDQKVRCRACHHHCLINEGQRGICWVRENRQGTLYSLVYGKPIAAHVDPIEKKPLFHFLPGSTSFSLATAGCNFRCLFCQNADISQAKDLKRIPGEVVPPEKIITAALQAECRSIAYTYTEPTIFLEYAQDVATLAREQGLRNVFVSNGFMTEASATELAGFIDADNLDLKSMKDDFYRKVCKARLQPVLDTIARLKQAGVWVEVTTLIIPGHNDSPEELTEIAQFIKSVGEGVPWHVTAFHPTFKMMDRPHTPAATLKKARDLGFKAGLRYVYTGNIPGVLEGTENTYCYGCQELLIDRMGYAIRKYRLKDGKCPKCQAEIDGVWK